MQFCNFAARVALAGLAAMGCLDTAGAQSNTLQVLPSAPLTFYHRPGDIPPGPQAIAVVSSGASLGFSAQAVNPLNPSTAPSWLLVDPGSGATPRTVFARVNPAGLSAGTYEATIRITAADVSNPSVSLPVTLIVGETARLTASPSFVHFRHQLSQPAPPPVNIAIGSTGAALAYTAAANTLNCGSNWLQVSAPAGSTPGSITVSINPASLLAGTCVGAVTVNSGGGSLTIPVIVSVTSQAQLTVAPLAIQLNAAPGTSGGVSIPINIASTSPASTIAYNISAATATGGGWLQLSSNGGTTPSSVTASANTTGLQQGAYFGTINIIAPLQAPVTIPVMLVISPQSTLSATPTSLSFEQIRNGMLPATRLVTVTHSTGAINFAATATTASGGPWLTVAPVSGTLPRELTVSVDGRNLTPGVYDGTIQVAVTGLPPLQIPVTMTVTEAPAPVITISPLAMTFNVQSGGPAPAGQSLLVTSTGTARVTLSTFTLQGGQWLRAQPAFGDTPLTATVSVLADGLAPGRYNGFVTVGSSVLPNPRSVPVTLNVTAAPAGPPLITSITNGGSFQAGPISPGNIVTIKGRQLGPAQGVTFALNGQGGIDPLLSGVRVLFDGIPGTPLYAQAEQINVVAPFELAGRTVTRIVVEYQGRPSSPTDNAVAAASPGLFTANSSGSGQAAIVNQNGSFNGAPAAFTIPAAPGSVISIYMTGGGQTDPPLTTGSVATGLRFVRNLTVTIGGRTLTPEYAGAAPTYTAGLYQINVRLPDDIPRGLAVPLTVNIGGVNSQPGTTMAIQ
ncbi:MAG: hypothetical protein K2X35_19965 [Bryobacteraceae bacterium]|nr:hypothetical protein [Bryobacteraceae bacterium]